VLATSTGMYRVASSGAIRPLLARGVAQLGVAFSLVTFFWRSKRK
jgi:hypothetical protein